LTHSSRITITLALAACCLQAQTPSDRMAWFQHDKLGMFIHFGPYSALAGEWNGHRIPVGDEAEWIMQRFNIPVAQYRELARGFNPARFDAEQCVALAKAAGMKYLVVTAKHHDGFAMYRSSVSHYNIVDWTPFKRDIVKELSDACRKAGIRFCVYYSHREDWDDPGGYGNNWDYDRAKKNFQRYLDQKSKPQLRELLTGYGPLGLVWFDRGMDTAQHAQQFVDMVHTLQPRCLINGRVGNYGRELMGDYQDMNDNGMPSGGLEEYWETPQTLNTTWGYSKFDQQWKSAGNVIQRLVEIVSKGGNYLLNIGPMGDGSIPAASVATLQKVGVWMSKNSQSIYGSSACPLPDSPWGRCTVNGTTIYLHVFSWPSDAILRVPALQNEVQSAYLLSDPSHKLKVSPDQAQVTVALPQRQSDDNDSVVVLQLASPPKVASQIMTQGSDSSFDLDYLKGVTAGKAVKRFNRDGKFHISKWTGPGDSITWHLLVSQTRKYRVRIRYAAPAEWAGGKFEVRIGGELLQGTVQATGEGYQYRAFDLPGVTLSHAGEYEVVIRPGTDLPHYLMYFESIMLEPVW
jgi:alpha-L-fucosidase